MMDRQQVVDYILNEAKRIKEEEHIDDLLKAGRYEELAMTDCKVSNAVTVYIVNKELHMREEEIPDGSYLAIAIWVNTIFLDDVIADEKKFADKLEAEAGQLGKAIASKMKRGMKLATIGWDDFFDISDPYDEEDE